MPILRAIAHRGRRAIRTSRTGPVIRPGAQRLECRFNRLAGWPCHTAQRGLEADPVILKATLSVRLGQTCPQLLHVHRERRIGPISITIKGPCDQGIESLIRGYGRPRAGCRGGRHVDHWRYGGRHGANVGRLVLATASLGMVPGGARMRWRGTANN
jgi:hypothetical protein